MFAKTFQLLLGLLLCAYTQAAPEIRYKILEERAHDPALFTQGLVMDGADLLESSGQYGSSFVRRYRLDSGKVLQENKLPKDEFAEGLAVVGQRLYLLTWREHTLYILDKLELKPLYKLSYEGEGWGLTFDGSHLIMSDGSDTLSYRNKKNFTVKRSVNVKDAGKPVSQLNELEYAWQSIWANVWREDRILQIDPLTGEVRGELRLGSLVKKNGGNFNKVLNGIAYDKNADALWITGKYWPKKYLIKVNLNRNIE